jgi:Hypothetical glycosyl hydrolase family 15
MHTKSLLSCTIHRFALITVFFIACLAEKATAQYRPFLNFSGRAQVVNGQDVIVVGFIIQTTATTTKRVLVRGMGPSYGLSLADPTITLYGPNGFAYTNNNWQDDPTQQSAIAATGFQPGNDLESAIIWDLQAGSYTVVLGANNAGTGIGLVELWDMGGSASIVNLSSRAQVGTGDNALITGTYVGDGTRAVIRGIGPTLGDFGIQGPLQDPTLELHDAQGTPIEYNDNWQDYYQSAEIQQLGLQPNNPSESVLLPTLAPGPYTVILRGLNDTTGVGMVELYALEDAPYPRIFQNWFNVSNLPNESEMQSVARHDLLWTTLNGFGLYWTDANGAVTQDYTSETLTYSAASQEYDIATLRSLNPRIKILGQIQHYSATLDGDDRLPSNSTWWKRVNGQLVPAPGQLGWYLLDQDNVDLRAHVAKQAKALMDRGNFDGIMLDSCAPNLMGSGYPGSSLDNLLADIRAQIGENALIIVNVNSSKLSSSELSKINGIFMECGKIGTGSGYPDWATVKDALDWNETYARSPRVNCLQDWYSTSPTDSTDMARMRAITTLALTHANGYANFGRDVYYWYDFWSNHSLGRSTGTRYSIGGGAERRDFQNGSAVYNQGPSQVTVSFSEQRTSLRTGQRATSFALPAVDGDIYIY